MELAFIVFRKMRRLKMKKEKSILLFLALMIVLSLGVNAVNTVTINTGNRIDGKQTDFNITFIGVADSTTLVNCSLSMISSSTANSSVGLLFNLSNWKWKISGL